ncbi:MAG: methionyl-tRNA formyltransferase [Pseudomonadales bacterium]|nr:methionyl-tRNA formyltransferase [Pseudomonadales bacterium]NIX08694.1 methionyl-tRNA formyltransferase [Pseudomonadales bacterium]
MTSEGGSRPRLGFAGTPDFAATILSDLIAAGHTPVVVYTQPDRPAGRGRTTAPSPVKSVATEQSIEIRQPATLKGNHPAANLAALGLDALVVAAYGLILPETIVNTPRYGCINVHASLLPRWRGAAPVERAIMAGDSETGVTIMQMDAGLDTGPIIRQARCPIGSGATGGELEASLARLGAECLLVCLPDLGGFDAQPQDDARATYAHKLSPADAAIDWNRAAQAIERQVRALYPRMPATSWSGDLRIRILRARATGEPGGEPGRIIAADRNGIRVSCRESTLVIETVQLNRGRGRPLSAADAVNGYAAHFEEGTQLA